MDWQTVTPLLSEKLDKRHVKPPKAYGPKGNYIEGWHAIAEANRIFGFGGWSYSILTMDKASLVEGLDSKGQPQWQAAYTCIVRVQVGDVTREDVGFGSGFSKQIGDAVEGATKEAVTDALKRALRTFGNPFGLALYDKSGDNVGDPEADRGRMAQEARADTDAAALIDAMERCATLGEFRILLSGADAHLKARADVKAAYKRENARIDAAELAATP